MCFEMKKCPVCKDTQLDAQRISANIEVDSCAKCGGMWFDKGEIGEFTNFSEDIPDFKRLVKEAKESAKKCPACSLGLKEMKYTGSSQLLIDYCENCSGLWLDGGETGDIKKISANPEDIKLRISREVWNLRFKLNKTSALSCPKCNAKTLFNFKTSEGVTVDVCNKCQGIWLDKGETAKSAELESDFPDYNAVAGTAVETKLACPSCGKKLFNMRYAKTSELMVEHCKGCGGIFLDAGEMSKVESVSAVSEGAGKKIARCLKEMRDEGYVRLM